MDLTTHVRRVQSDIERMNRPINSAPTLRDATTKCFFPSGCVFVGKKDRRSNDTSASIPGVANGYRTGSAVVTREARRSARFRVSIWLPGVRPAPEAGGAGTCRRGCSAGGVVGGSGFQVLGLFWPCVRQIHQQVDVATALGVGARAGEADPRVGAEHLADRCGPWFGAWRGEAHGPMVGKCSRRSNPPFS